MIWQLPEYPTHRARNGSKNSSISIGSASPLKREEREDTVVLGDYQFDQTPPYLVEKFTVVGDSDNTRMGAVDWARDEIEGKVLIAA